MNVWLKTALALAAVWLLAFGVIHYLHVTRPTAASVTASLSHTNLAAQSPRERARILRSIEDQLNDLPLEERQQLQRGGSARRFFDALTPAEQSGFLDATLPADFRQLMEALNAMEPAKRKEIVTHALDEMKKHQGEGLPPGADEALVRRVTDQGLKSFYQDANADVKLDLAPLIEQMQRNLQGN